MAVDEYEIEYGATRPLKFRSYVLDSELKEWFLDVVYEFIVTNVNIDTITKLDNDHYCRLLEKVAIMICKAESPTTNYGITKPELRSAIRYWFTEIPRVEAAHLAKGDRHNGD
jgi:hypothetical protein